VGEIFRRDVCIANATCSSCKPQNPSKKAIILSVELLQSTGCECPVTLGDACRSFAGFPQLFAGVEKREKEKRLGISLNKNHGAIVGKK
jgi:hypothetical protein